MAKSKKSRSKRRSGGRSKGVDPKWVIAGVAVLAAVGVYFATSGSASASTGPAPAPLPPPVSARGTTPTPARRRSATTAAKPMMPSDLAAMLRAPHSGGDNARVAFFDLAALFTLDNSVGAPTVASVGAASNAFSATQLAALRRLGITDATRASVLAAYRLIDKLAGKDIVLPYQVPQDIVDNMNVYLRDILAETFEEIPEYTPALQTPV
jgi:hypothetical protein